MDKDLDIDEEDGDRDLVGRRYSRRYDGIDVSVRGTVDAADINTRSDRIIPVCCGGASVPDSGIC